MRKGSAMVLGMAATLCIGLAASAAETEGLAEPMAAETEELAEPAAAETGTESVSAAETGDPAGAAEAGDALETILVQIEGAEEPLKIANTAGLDITAASVEAQDEEGVVTITMVDGAGQEYLFENVQYEIMIDPELVKEGLFAEIRYTSLLSGKESSAPQSGELVYDKAVEQFAVDDVYIRSEPDSDSEILGVINRGDAIEVQGETATHYLVKKGDVTGYTVRRCISEDEQEAIAAVKAEEAAREAIRAAEAAAAQAQAAAAQQSSVSEVKRQKFDDCDGSGHGYYLITYSDGSTSIQEY